MKFKNLLIFTFVLLTSNLIFGQQLSENFNYGTTLGDLRLVSNGAWVAHSGQGLNGIQYLTNSLTLPGFSASTTDGSAFLGNGSGTREDLNLSFPATVNSGANYYALLMKVDTVFGTGDYNVHTLVGSGAGGGAFFNRVYIKPGVASNTVDFGFAKNANAKYELDDAIPFGSTVFIVVKHEFLSSDVDTARFWLFTSSLPSTEPAALIVDWAGSDPTFFGSIGLRQGSTGFSRFSVDGIKVGSTWAEVTSMYAACTNPSISAQPINQSNNVGSNVTFSVTATGNNLNYQWQVSTNDGTNWNNVPNTNNATLTLTNVQSEDNDNQYRVIVSSGSCSVTSNTAELTVLLCSPPTPSISVAETSGTINNDGTICSGDQVILTATGGTTYLWSNSATTSSITVNPNTTTTYSVTATTNGCSGNTSSTITINSLPTASIVVAETSGTTNNDGTICSGANATLTASGGTTFVWSTGATTESISQSPTSTTTYSVTVANANGCTASTSQTLTVVALPNPSISVSETSGTANNDGTICNGASATMTASGGTTYAWSTGATTAALTQSPTTTTTYTVTATTSGCQGTASETIAVNNLPIADIAVTENSGLVNNDGTICIGDLATLTASGGVAYEWSNNATTAAIDVNPNLSSSFSVTVIDENGCSADENVDLIVTALPSPSSQDITLCFGESLTVGANTYTSSGTYTDIFVGVNGCDSVVTTNLFIKPFVSSNQTVVLCAGESFTIGTSVYTTSGNYTDVFTAIDGCDSTVYTDLTISDGIVSSQAITVCFGESYTIGTNTYTTSGTYSDVFTAINGCDSTVTTNLTVLDPITHTQNVNICFGTSYSIGTSTYTQAGTYLDTLISAFGCDSIVTTVLSINEAVNVATTLNDLTIAATASNATYQWINCATNQAIAGATNQTFTATANGDYAVIVTQNGCSDTSACVTIDNVGLTEIDATSIAVYPNPATTEVNISSSNGTIENIAIYNTMGQLISTESVNANSKEINLTNYSTGVYVFKIQTNSGFITKRVVVK